MYPLLKVRRRNLNLDLCSNVQTAALPSATNIQDCSGAVGGFVREQPQNSVGYFYGLASAFHGDGFFQAVNSCGITTSGMKFCVDQAGADGVYSDSLSGNFFG